MNSGLVLIDKPQGLTSHDVVARIRRLAGTRRVGHAGTLDPMATGLLILGINSATKLLTFLVGADKTYEATIRLGASTITDDKESDFLELASTDAVTQISATQIEAAIKDLSGEILQVPSSVSAIKVDGQRAYAKVRGGDQVKLAARPVTISRFEIVSEPKLVTEGGNTFIDFNAIIDCSSGTYIRALARDLGRALGVGGHLTALRRTRVGHYSIEQAQSLDALTRESSPDALQLLPIEQAAAQQFQLRVLTDQEVIDLRHGKRLAHAGEGDQVFAGVDSQQKLIAMLERSGSQVKSVVVFANTEEGENV